MEPTIKNNFVLFWNTYLSNWHACSFIVAGTQYNCAEQWMMAEKAKMFKDDESLKKIMASNSPREQKALGKKVANFDKDAWMKECCDRVKIGLMAKFKQNPELMEKLLNTGDMVIVEASPLDVVWGIGLSEDDPDAIIPEKWKGLNLLGICLMDVRKALKEEQNG